MVEAVTDPQATRPTVVAGSHIYMTCIGGQDNSTRCWTPEHGRRHRFRPDQGALELPPAGHVLRQHPQSPRVRSPGQPPSAHNASTSAARRSGTSTASRPLTHTTSVACDSNQFYLADYTGNASYQDMYTLSLTGSAKTSGLRAGYGGFLIAVYGNDLYRTALSNTYNLNNLTPSTARTSSTRSTVATASRQELVGDMCHDGIESGCRATCTTVSRTRSCCGASTRPSGCNATGNNITTCGHGTTKGFRLPPQRQ